MLLKYREADVTVEPAGGALPLREKYSVMEAPVF